MSLRQSLLAALPLSLLTCVGSTNLVAQDRAAYALLIKRGDAALDRFDLETAEARFAEALTAGEAAGVALHELIELGRRLAQVQGLRGHPKLSIVTLQRAIDRIEKAPGSHTVDRLGCMHDLAVKLRENGSMTESLEMARRALALVEPDGEDADLAQLQLLDCLAKAAIATADHATLLASANQTIAIITRSSGADSGDLALPLKQAAQALHALGRDREAITVIRRWIGIHEKIRGADNPGVAEGLENLLASQIAARELDDADQTLQRWITLLNKVTTDHPNLVDTSVWAARILTVRGRLTEAADQLENALQRGKIVLWNRQQRLGEIALELARMSREAGRLERAKAALQDARKYHATFGSQSLEALRLAIESAHQALAEGRPQEAATEMTATLERLEKIVGKSHGSLVEPLELLARAYLALDRKPDAAAAAERARSIADKR